MSDMFFERARKEVDLVNFVESLPGQGQGKKNGNSLRWSCCPVCGESKDKNSVRFSVAYVKGKMMSQCFSCDFIGDVSDLAAKIWNMTALEAAKALLLEDRPVVVVHHSLREPLIDVDGEAKAAALQEVLKGLRTVTKNIYAPKVRSYLEGRGLSKKTLDLAIERGILGMMPDSPYKANDLLVSEFGVDKLIAAGLWSLNEDGSPKKMAGVAFRPLVFFLPDCRSAEFRLIEVKDGDVKARRYGSSNYPWFWRGTESGLMAVEGPIDFLSAVELGYTGSIVGLAGVKNWKVEWFENLVAAGIGKAVTIAFDNDLKKPNKNPGQEWAARLMAALTERGVKSINQLLPPGDINDVLIEQVKKQRLLAA